MCVFDILGKSGEAYKMMQDWALAAKGWGADVNLIAMTDEQVADNNFKAGKCAAVAMTAMRARPYNKFAGSIDSIGGAFRAMKSLNARLRMFSMHVQCSKNDHQLRWKQV